MNKLVIIGNLTADPELRSTTSGISVCTFTVAVNRRSKSDKQEADFFRVTAWRELGETCSKFLAKGRKVAVTGAVSVSSYQGKDGKAYANLEVRADEVEFLTSVEEAARMAKAENAAYEAQNKIDPKSGMQQVNVDDDLPFD